jgi:putative sigma-54 modulation protein
MAAVTHEIVGRNFEVTPDIRALIESKLGRVEDRLFQGVSSVRVMLHAEKHRNTCEILIVARDHDAKAVQESQTSMADAINAAVDHIKRQAQKNREKIRDHHRGEPEPVAEESERVS